MTDLTKEYLDKNLKELATKDDLTRLATKEDLTKQTKELKAFTEGQTESLARIIAETVVLPMDKGFNNLERGQEDIKLKLDNVAYRFELQELQRRVELLEKKAGFVR